MKGEIDVMSFGADGQFRGEGKNAGIGHSITHKSAEYSCNVEKGHNPLKNYAD